MRLSTLLVAASLVVTARAQDTGDCAVGTARVFLENAGVRAPLYNTGSLFWNDPERPALQYEAPRGSGVPAVFASSLWIGGLANGEPHDFRFAGSTYGPYEFWPGPLADDGGPSTAESCAAADHVWRVTLADVARYNATREATADLASWPVHLGAPVVDGDGDPSNYALPAGDRPAIIGDETAWWIMNDAGNLHRWSGKRPLRLEVRVTAFTVSEAYAASNPFLTAEMARDVHNATFYRYQFRYRGDAPLEEVYVGWHTDFDVGDYLDDYVGTSVGQDMVYAYNGTPEDSRYGGSPPAVGLRILRAPLGKPLTGAMRPAHGSSLFDGGSGGDRGRISYQYLQSIHLDGVPLTRGGNGYNPGSSDIVRYQYSGLPRDFWSEENVDGLGGRTAPGDRQMLTSHGPFSLSPGDTFIIDQAIVWARSEHGAVESVYRLVQEAAPAASAVSFDPDPRLATILPEDLPTLTPEPEAPVVPERLALAASARPTPASNRAVVRFDLPREATVRLDAFDATGRRVAVLVAGSLAAGERRVEADVSRWAPGVYMVRLTVDGVPLRTARLVVAR